MKKELMIIAGEASGDLHGASLIKELKKKDPDVLVCGIGGSRMQATGMELLFHINQMAFLGFVEVIKHLPFIKKVQISLLEEVKKRNIGIVVLIDYPGFNLSIAGKLKECGIKIIYYISPQVWAWGRRRVNKIKRLVDKMIVILPFEEKFFRQAGIDVEYVGHPLLEQIKYYNYLSRDDFFDKFSLDKNKEILLLLPGSRMQEIKRIFPESILAAGKIAGEFNMQVVVACSSDIDEIVFREQTDTVDFKIIKDHTYDLLKHAKFGIIKSGTSTLEAALSGLPMVVVYATNQLTYMIGKMLIKIDMIGLVNIVAGEKIVRELIQKDVNEKCIYEVCRSILSDVPKYQEIKCRLENLYKSLGELGASKRSAEIIHLFLTGSG
ncbi:MAG: lipid-A-disaccharide synthase [Ignavibacteria bacterium]